MYLPLFLIWSLVCRASHAQFMPICSGPSYFSISIYENLQLFNSAQQPIFIYKINFFPVMQLNRIMPQYHTIPMPALQAGERAQTAPEY